jgi:hypothetical protein
MDARVAFCTPCGQRVFISRRSGAMAFHIALVVLTAGLWFPAWILMVLLKPGWKCAICGSKVDFPSPESQSAHGLRERIAAHFARYQKLPPWTFTWRVALESIGFALVAGTAAAMVLPHEGLLVHRLHMTPGQLFVRAVLLAPVIETLLFQFLVIEIAARLGAGFMLQIALSMVPFAVAHFFVNGPVNGVAAGVVGGFYLAFTYATWRPRSRRIAFGATAGMHALINSLAFMALLLFKGH